MMRGGGLWCDTLLLPCVVSGVVYVYCDNPIRFVDCAFGFGRLFEAVLLESVLLPWSRLLGMVAWSNAVPVGLSHV